jgi:hypothetical protein
MLPNGVARQLRPPLDLPYGQMLAQGPTPNNAQKCHVDQYKLPCYRQPRGKCHMGQFSMKIAPPKRVTSGWKSTAGPNAHAAILAKPTPLFRCSSCTQKGRGMPNFQVSYLLLTVSTATPPIARSHHLKDCRALRNKKLLQLSEHGYTQVDLEI